MENKVFIVAELSANHGGKIETAIETIKAAKRAGANAIKLQTYTADTITIDSNKPDFMIKSGTIWDNRKLHNLYLEAYLPWEWHNDLFKTAEEQGLICFSSPFDKSAVDFLEKLDCPIYKIASFEITDIPLIKYVASKGKPIIISTGIAEYEDIKLAVETCREIGNNDITVLKCTSSYPAPVDEANLIMIKRLAKDFNVKVGLSDHTLGITVPIVAVSMGACIIEKHFILDRSIGGPDASFSLNESEFTEMVKAVREAEISVGKESYELTSKQISSKAFARSLYATEDINEGESFTEVNVRSIRPGYGLHPKYLGKIIGLKSPQNFKRGDRIEENLLHLLGL